MLGKLITSLLVLLPSSATQLEDESRVISVVLVEDKFEVLSGWLNGTSVVVWANLTNAQSSTGWMFLEISSNPEFPDHIQAKAAGFAEGYLTRNLIYKYFQEFFSKLICSDEESQKVCQYFKEKVEINDKFVSETVKQKSESDPYWHMVSLFYQQLDGLTEGFLRKSNDDNLDYGDFDVEHGTRLINYLPDFFDYMEKYKLERGESGEAGGEKTRPSCSVLIKHLAESGELLVGHNTWHEYRAMGYRLLKRYSLHYHTLSGGEEEVPGHTLTMSSFAGTILSTDDFLTVNTGLVTTETTLYIYNTSLFGLCDPASQLFESVRVMTANRLATTGEEWTEIMARNNGGTYNNQWMVVDYNKLQEDGQLESGALWVYEQLPGETWAEDKTEELRRRGYWISYNRAHFPEVFTISGEEDMTSLHGNYFSYEESPRAVIMRREQAGVVDEETMIQFMRFNDFQNDPAALIDGCNKPVPAGSVANRCDLTLPGTVCEWEEMDNMVGHQGYGALDMKVTTSRLLRSGQQFWAVAGPTHDEKTPPFSWSNTNLTDKPFYTPISTFDFKPQVHAWML